MFHRPSHAAIEVLEARIAPALAVLNPLADLVVGPGKTGADIDLSRIFDPIISDNGHTIVTLKTNFDSDPATEGIQGDIVIEMLDDEAPLTVQNFLSYLTNSSARANYEDTFFHRSVSGFVVQGGGFDITDPANHIPTGFDVHNEFDGVNRSNLAGTIAMAKTGLGPNTAGSEWFFNLANNSSNLDNQNGGFTVFARVVSGMNIVNGIAALSTFDFTGDSNSIGNLNGAFSDLPLQNYNSDPDGNPNTPAPPPTANNYVRLTGYTIQPPPSGTPTGVTFTISAADIVDATSGQPSDLVSANVSGSTLHLNYKAHAAGAVRITVHASDGAGSTAEETFAVNLQPNLVANFEQDPFDGMIIGGDTKTANIVVGNNGGGWAVGNVNVKVYASKIESGGTDTTGVLIEPGKDILIASFENEAVDIAGGGSLTLSKTLQIPRVLVTGTNGTYRILVEVKPADRVIDERFSDDNVALDSKVHLWDNQFGTFTVAGFGTRTDAKLVYEEPDGDVVQFSITKQGIGRIDFDGTVADVVVSNVRPAAVLSGALISSVSVGERDIDLHNLELQNYIHSVQMPLANLSGSLTASAGFRDLVLGNLTGPNLITVGKLPRGVTINPTMTFQSVSDVSVESLSRFRLIRAAEWIETDGTPDRIDAPSIGNLAIRGNLEASIALTTSGRLGVFYVGGFFKESTLTTRANIGVLNVGGLDHANIFVGTTSRPDDASDFAQVRAIASLTVRGVAGEARSFIASNVAASTIGTISVVDIDAINSPTRFGIVADAIRSYVREGGPSSGPLTEPQRFDGRGRYSLTIV